MNNNQQQGNAVVGGQTNNGTQQVANTSTQQVNDTNKQIQPQQPAIQNSNIQAMNQMQNIPTVEQSKEQFIDNTQSISTEKKEEKSGSVNYVFIIILFVIIFAAIFFLFPILLEKL